MGLESGSGWRPFGVLTLHRPSNVDSTGTLLSLLGAVEEITNKLPIIFPVHPRTEHRLSEAGLRCPPGLRLVPPVGYLDFLNLLSQAKIVLTDSGGIQEESTVLGVPCLTLRENTERPVTVREGTNEIVGQSPARILEAAQKVLSGRGKTGRIPRLWDGHAAERIVGILLRETRTAGIPQTSRV